MIKKLRKVSDLLKKNGERKTTKHNGLLVFFFFNAPSKKIVH